MKIAILNQPLANRGDESAHKAFIRSLIKALPDTQIDVIVLSEREDKVTAIKVIDKNVKYIVLTDYRLMIKPQKISLILQNQELSFLHPGLRKFKNMLKEYDSVICAPGGICMGGFLNWSHIWQLLVAKKIHKPIMYWGRSIGPFTEEDYQHTVFKKYSYQLLNYFSYVSLRDSKSVEIANKIGIKVDEVVDSAFLETPNALIPEVINENLKDNEYVVFVPNELTWHYSYRKIEQEKIDDFYLQIINYLQQNSPDVNIVMLPQTYKSEINDQAYFERLKQKSECRNIIVIDENQNSDIQQAIVAKSKLVIGARYHSIVFAINNNIPFISLSYEHKMKGLLEKLYLTDNMVEIQDIFEDDEKYIESIQKIDELLTKNNEKPNSTEAKQIVKQGFDRMIDILLK